MFGRAVGLGVALLLLAHAADARVTRIEISRQESFAGEQTFGTAGAYEKLIGRFYGELDPKAPLNAGIVDLDKAPRNAKGMVEYSSDFYILRPVDLAKGNGALLYDVNNRGNKQALFQFNSAARSNDPSTAQDAGNGFLMREGFTVVWSGWLPDLPDADHNLRLTVPVARNSDGSSIIGKVWDEFLFNDTTTAKAKLSFTPVNPDTAHASLLVRDRNTAPPQALAPTRWEFVDAQTIRLLPAGTAFAIGKIYQLVYEARDPPVAGIGLAATRDWIAFLRHAKTDDFGNVNPLASGGRAALARALAHGTSQSGRYLRDFVYRGFNEDEAGRIVFDGINVHIGAGRTFLDFRFAQPERMQNVGHGFVYFPNTNFPFAYENEHDPFTDVSDGILARCTARGNCPKVMHTESGIEYWQSGESLVTTDPSGRRDATLPSGVRVYHMASTQHVDSETMPPGVCAEPWNKVDRRPVLRALLLALDRWVKDGTKPPPSRYPRIDDGTLVAMADWHFDVAGVERPAAPNDKPRFDYGPDFAQGIIDKVLPEKTAQAYTRANGFRMRVDKVLPEKTAQAYAVLVPQVDVDGNEVGGVRLPDITVPLGTATGWALRSEGAGGAGELCYLDGSYIAFAKTKAERLAKGDKRLSIEERYRTKADYVMRTKYAATALEKSGYILAEDRERIIERAEALPW